MISLPEWMHPEISPDKWHTSPLPENVTGANKRKRNTVRGAVGSFAHIMASFLADDKTAGSSGLLQGIDARAKVLGLIGLVIITTMLHNLPSLVFSYIICVFLAILSNVPFRRFAGVWLVVPLFSAMIMIPATLNIVTPGNNLFMIWRNMNYSIGPWHLPQVLAVTDSGLLIAARFILRTATCVSLTVLLASTTRPAKLFRALHLLGVPQIFITLLTMMERYLGILIRSAEEIHLAKISRSITVETVRQEHAWIAAGMVTLFRRTHTLSNAIYLAMISRGYTGDIYLLKESSLRTRDWLFLAASAISGALLIYIGKIL